MTKKILAFILAMITVVSCFSATTVFGQTVADDYEIQPRMTYIASTTGGLTIKGLKAYCMASVSAKQSASLKIEMQLQKKSGDSYTAYKTWTASKTGTSLTLGEEQTVNPLSTWRLRVYCSAGNETMTNYYY